MSKNKIDNILPDDGKLLDRVKIFSELCEKYAVKYDDEKNNIKIRDIPYFESDKESLVASNNSEEEFEDKSVADEDQDPDFDVRKTLDDTLQIVQNRENNWRHNGIVKAMETFNTNVSEKVQDWIRNNDSYYSSKCNKFFEPSKRISSGLKLYDEEFHIRNQELISDDESLQSVNTAKYILSNRKKFPHRTGKNYISGHFTAMTIKQFCCYNRQQSLVSNDVNQCLKIKTNKPNLHSVLKDLKYSPENKKYPTTNTFDKENEKSPQKLRKKAKFRRKNKYPNSSYSLESSTDTTDQSILDENYKTKPKLISKSQNMYRKEKHSHSSKKSCESEIDSDLNNIRQKIRNKIPLAKENKCMHTSSHSDINFNIESIINSTEINKSKDSKIKRCLGTKNNENSKYTHESSYSSDECNLNKYKCDNVKKKHQKVNKKKGINRKGISSSEFYEPSTKSTYEPTNFYDKNYKNKHKSEINMIHTGKKKDKHSLINFKVSNSKVCNNTPKCKKLNIKQFQQSPNEFSSDTTTDSSLISLNARKNPEIFNSEEKALKKNKKKWNTDSDSEHSDNIPLKRKSKINAPRHKQMKYYNLNTIMEEENPTPEKFSCSVDINEKCGKKFFPILKDNFKKKVKVKVKRLKLNKKETVSRLHSKSLESFKSLSNENIKDESTEIKLSARRKTLPKDKISKYLGSTQILKELPFSEKYDNNKKENDNANTLKILNKNKQEVKKKNNLQKCIANSLQKMNNEKILESIYISDNSEKNNKISNKIQLKKINENKYSQSSRSSSVESFKSNFSTNNKSTLFRKSFNSREPHIVLYDPDDEDYSKKYSGNSNEGIVINESTLESKIGLNLTRKFLNGRISYKKNFNKQSTIIFILPHESDLSNCTESEIDELEKSFEISANKTGKIVEVIKYKHC